MTNPARPPPTPNGASQLGGGHDGHGLATSDASGFVPISTTGANGPALAPPPQTAPPQAAPGFGPPPYAAPQYPPAGGYPPAPGQVAPVHNREAATALQLGATTGPQLPPTSDGKPGLGPLKPTGPDPHLGKTLDGRYLIEKVLGEGGMGVVYAAKHAIIGKRIAIKILRSEYTRDQEILDRFVLEAQTASSIGNPHIVDISDFGRMPDGGTYFVMEFLEGESLADAMTTMVRGEAHQIPIELERLYNIALQICDGLGAAHDRGIVHRDLKPDNIFLIKRPEPDFVKILDFGIAKVTSDNPTQKLTRAGAVFGTPQYMSPEQAAGGSVDRRADIYALGVILYEMVSGQLPFDGDNFMGILTQHMYKAPVPVRALVNTASCPPGLEAVIQKCLHKRADLRYQTMSELADDIRRVAQKLQPKAVNDLMGAPASSGVPHDYFKSAQHAIVPAAPSRAGEKGFPAWIWVVGVVSAIVLVAAALFVRKTLNTKPIVPANSQTVVSPPVTASETASSPSAAPTVAAAAVHPVVTLDLTPTTAIIKRNGKVLMTHELKVLPGEKISLEVSAKGFLTRTVVVDGTESPLSIVLDKPGAPQSAGAHPGGKGSGRTDGVVDPW